MANNRSFSRVDFTIDALLTQDDQVIRGEVKNVSLQGVFVETGQTLNPEKPVNISIHLTGTSPEIAITATGNVVRADVKGLGIHFTKVDVDSFVHLRNVVSYQCGDGDKVIGEFFKYLDGQGKND